MKVQYPSEVRKIASRFGCELGTHADLSRFGGATPYVGKPIKSTTVPGLILLPNGNAIFEGKAYTSVAAALKAKATKAQAAKALVPNTPPVPTAPLPPPVNPAVAVEYKAPPIAVKEEPIVFKYETTSDSAKTVAAMAAADKLLADPSVSNAGQIVETTMIAARNPVLDPATQQSINDGAAMLEAMMMIREEMGVGPNEPAIPVETPAQVAAVNAAVKASVHTLSADESAAIHQAEKIGWLKRFKNWLRSLLE